MARQRLVSVLPVLMTALVLSGCGGNTFGSLGLGGGQAEFAAAETPAPANATAGTPPPARSVAAAQPPRRGFFGQRRDDPLTTIQVNKYIWGASLDVLSFLPVETADPFTGVIVTGYGTPPGGGRAYRATIFVQDPALDARSLKVALHTRSGPVSADIVLAVEDAILSRARQIRRGDARL